MISIGCSPLHLDLAPEVGGAIARFYSAAGERSVDWLRPASSEAFKQRNALQMASFPLVPFCGRIRDGRFMFSGTIVTLEPNFGDSPHTIHGCGWRSEWQVTRHDSNAAHLALSHRGGDWPFAFEAEQRFTLTTESLTIELTVSNSDQRPIPMGIGHHPYFPFTSDTIVQTHVTAMWETDSEMLPVKLARNEIVSALADGLRLDTVTLDNNFVGWQHTATVRWPELGRSLRMTADAPLSYLVLYTPPRRDYFCMEPVSNTTDWLNLGHVESVHTGGTVLAPGAALRARLILEPEFDDSNSR